MLTAKLWGTTEDLVRTPLCEIHRIRVLPGGFCSDHIHKHKWNAFAVLEGILDVEYAGASVSLTRGDVVAVPPNVEHRFFNHSSKPVLALEVYYPEVLSEDIVRSNTGGIL